ncbi:choice-of-anchor Q domain-containing protein [Hymenobacter bucti]|uniref:Choice-of-anchor Q domain-containing protein n=1 Tax=Hymenobacter bucti TaxID=1844114 RepID=A0ABW4R1M9_9BACT
MKKLLLLYLALNWFSSAWATNYYVSGGANSLVTGADNTTAGRGLSPALPFATVQYAANLTLPGDTVFVRQGTYRGQFSFSPTLDVTRPGTASAWIVYTNYRRDAQRPLFTLQTNTFQGVHVYNTAAYVEVSGFRVQGNNRSVTLGAALNQPSSCANPTGSPLGLYNANGISTDGTSATGYPHHLRFANNEVFECGGAGIAMGQSDYVAIENNLVYNNCWYTRYGTSGISINSSVAFDNAPGYHIVIRNNRSFGNRLYVPWRSGTVCRGITDGNGIILDVNPGYSGKFLVANNLCVNNGGSGFQCLRTSNIDLINNTFYQNSRSPDRASPGDRVEVLTNQSANVLVQNNILVTDNETRINVNFATTNLTYTNNLFFGGIGTGVAGTNTVTADPQFVSASVAPFTADFRLRPGSPAINAGVNNLLPATDLAGNPRVVGATVDIGAYEFDAALSPSFTTWVGGGSTDWNTSANWSAGVPSAALDGYLPAATAPYPVITANTTIQSLVIGSGASLTLNGGVLDVKGSLNNSGTFTAASSAGITLTGTTPQGLGGPSTIEVSTLTLNNPAGASLGGRVRIRGVLTLTAGSLTANDRLTLVSDATGTALVNNAGTGTVSGISTVQRYIDPSLNPGRGYRHFSSPVAGTTVADLTTTGFTPEISQAAAYNASATPGTTTPFPTVFGYDQSRVSLNNNYTPFDRGFLVPATTATTLAVGRGYAVNINAPALVDFVGVLTNGDQSVALTRAATGTANESDAGWQLLGNPYASPLDYSLVAPTDRLNLDAAIYVFSSTSQYGGQYRSYVSGIGNPILSLGQGFFARVSSGQTTGTLTFRNSQRLTAPNATAFQRAAADLRPQVQLELLGANGLADAFYAYAETSSTPDFDAQHDAQKLTNPSGLNLASVAGTGESLSIDGRPVFTVNTTLPLTVGVPAAGSYSLTAATLSNLPASLDAVLTDALTGQTVNLRQQPAYAFSVSPAAAGALIIGRFTLHFAARTTLATAPALSAAEVSLYPNPATSGFTVLVPAVAGATQVHVELLNTLGQVVHRQQATLPAAGARLAVDAMGLATGVYTLRLQVGTATLVKRVVLQ